jgi:hypothetical protein
MLVFIADIVPQMAAGPDADSRFILPPQTPVLVEAAAPAHPKPHIQRQQREHIMRSATVKPEKPLLSIREAAARAIEIYLEKVLLCMCSRGCRVTFFLRVRFSLRNQETTQMCGM